MPQHRVDRFQPIPGTEPPKRALFVKRWGTLLERSAGGPGATVGDAPFTAGATDALFRAVQAGWRVYLIGNEDDVAFGRWPTEHWTAFHGALLERLSGLGIPVAHSYACLDHPSGKGRHRRKSVFQLPDTGLFFHAVQNDGVILRESWVISDESTDLVAGERTGCRTAAVRTGRGLADGEFHVEPEFMCDDLAEALDVLTRELQRRRA